jgi:YfiH family protein
VIQSREGLQWIEPDWPAPANVRAVSTLRCGGVSLKPFDTLNLATHVGDDSTAVKQNRSRLSRLLQLPQEPCWLQQVHGAQVIAAGSFHEPPIADASTTSDVGKVCVVMTADCLPVLLCSRNGDRVAAAHGGWRGLAAGVLATTVRAMNVLPAQLFAWLGPAIGCQSFEVGDEVREAFLARNAANSNCFYRNNNQRWQADLYSLARNELRQLGVSDIFSEPACTVTDASHFFSYRRDGQTGRMASMIWLHAR